MLATGSAPGVRARARRGRDSRSPRQRSANPDKQTVQADNGRSAIRSRRRNHEVQFRDIARLSAARVDRAHQAGRRTRLLRMLRSRRDLAQGPVRAVRGCRVDYRAHPLGAQSGAGRVARADLGRAGGRHARRAQRRARRVRHLHRELQPPRAVWHGLDRHEDGVSCQGGAQGDAHLPRRGRVDLRRRVLQLMRDCSPSLDRCKIICRC